LREVKKRVFSIAGCRHTQPYKIYNILAQSITKHSFSCETLQCSTHSHRESAENYDSGWDVLEFLKITIPDWPFAPKLAILWGPPTPQIGHLLPKEGRRPAAGLPQACRRPAAGLLWACWGTADTPDLNSQKS